MSKTASKAIRFAATLFAGDKGNDKEIEKALKKDYANWNEKQRADFLEKVKEAKKEFFK
tara:strand:- start:41 stop:217 length:177 start_codon:yes stop_codon:yes gene_type:complete